MVKVPSSVLIVVVVVGTVTAPQRAHTPDDASLRLLKRTPLRRTRRTRRTSQARAAVIIRVMRGRFNDDGFRAAHLNHD